jgi:hypothetical protein
MNDANQRLSVPRIRKTLPRPLTADELATLTDLADRLCGPSDRVAPPSQHDEFPAMLDLALATRDDSFEAITTASATAQNSADRSAWLRSLYDGDPKVFQALSAVLAGAYLMVPQVREAVGYPGQHRNPAKLEEAVDEISDGILDPVLERGHFFVPTPKGA